MEETIKLNVYDENDNIIKTVEAQFVELRFGTIRGLMELLNVENIEDTGELLKTVYQAWDKLTLIMKKMFPDLNEDDWDNLKLSEVVPVFLQILRTSFVQILSIPTESKN